MTEPTAREEFGARQAQMTAGWFENVKRRHGDVEAYIRTRWAAYLDRWAEAARFIPKGSRVLDIGGGNHFEQLLRFIGERGYRYSYLDVDPESVETSRTLAASLGMPSFVFERGFNDSLPMSDNSFDAVFSSHCIEHSFNLPATFSEIRRVLVERGTLCMAVPLGWEMNPEHPYFFGTTEWLALLRQSGFRIRTAQMGSEYPETGYDLFLCVERLAAPPGGPALDPEDFRKTNFDMITTGSDRIRTGGTTLVKEDHIVSQGTDWEIDIVVPKGTREILPIMMRHEWSGVAQISCDGVSAVEDLYSWFNFVQPMRLKFDGPLAQDTVARLRPVGRNLASASSEGVIYGVLHR